MLMYEGRLTMKYYLSWDTFCILLSTAHFKGRTHIEDVKD